MQTIQLTQGFVALVDDADYERVSAMKWHALVAKNKRTVYAVHGKGLRMHRFILGLTDPKVQTDHEDGDGLNNQRHNLRICDNSQNNINRKKSRGVFTSQFKGVHFDKRKWRAQLWVRRKKQCLGSFTSEIDAALAYDSAVRAAFGEFAVCNFPPRIPCASSAPASTIPAGSALA